MRNRIHRNKCRLVVILYLLAVLYLALRWGRFQGQKSSVKFPSITPALKLFEPAASPEKIVIGMVVCVGGYANVGRGKNETRLLNEAAAEPLTLIKSVLLSGKVSRVKEVDFHIFTDGWMITNTIRKTVDEYREIMREYIHVTVYYYNAFDSVPKGYERDFMDNIRRCGYVRLFFPSSLPSNLTEILYLDTDIIITGNITQIWADFKGKVLSLNSTNHLPKLAAMVQNSEVGRNYMDIFVYNFMRIPHVPPRGVNSGVIFMNLDAMRKFNWEKKVMDIFKERRSSLGGDQQLINVLFHDHLDRLALFPCQYNFQHLHCEKGLACRNVTTDPGGIHIMHGAGGHFHIKRRSHNHLYLAFKQFNIELHQEVVSRLYKPVMVFYNNTLSRKRLDMTTCNGTIGKYLFKQLVGGFSY